MRVPSEIYLEIRFETYSLLVPKFFSGFLPNIQDFLLNAFRDFFLGLYPNSFFNSSAVSHDVSRSSIKSFFLDLLSEFLLRFFQYLPEFLRIVPMISTRVPPRILLAFFTRSSQKPIARFLPEVFSLSFQTVSQVSFRRFLQNI